MSRRWGSETSAEGQDEVWIQPPLDECFAETVAVPVDTENLITMRRVEWHGQLVEYAIIHSRKNSDGEWVEVTCIDTKHGAVHRHRGRNHVRDPEDILPIRAQEDVQQSFKASYDAVFDSYEESVKGAGR